jgi:hypothetical protein
METLQAALVEFIFSIENVLSSSIVMIFFFANPKSIKNTFKNFLLTLKMLTKQQDTTGRSHVLSGARL